jgi:hypothetical protein
VGAGGTQGANNGGNGGNGGASLVTYNSATVAEAAGGSFGTGSTNGARNGGTGATTGTGTVRFGGNGGNGYIGGSFDFGGGGGGGAGSNTNGGNGTTSTGTPVVPPPGGTGGTVGGGNGGNGYQGLGGSGSVGSAPGGGGGGAAAYNGASGSGGAGGAGRVVITYTTCVPATPGVVSGLTSPCSGTITTYSIATVSGATSYTWTLPNGWSGTSTTETIITTVGTQGGTTSVTADNGCGSSAAQILNVTTNTSPATPTTISGLDTVCSNSLNNYSVAPVSGATSYTWSLPNSWSGTSTTANISATAGTVGGTVSVTANNSCGSSAAQVLNVTVNLIPATPTIISGSDTVCSNSLNNYSVATVSGATEYTWTLPIGWSGASTTDNVSATAGNVGGTVLVTANNGCGNSLAQTLTVTVISVPVLSGNITGADSVCDGSAATYSVGIASGAASYTWVLPNGWQGNSTTESIDATAIAQGGTISVTANNTCGSGSPLTKSITVNPTPQVTFDITSGPVCNNLNPTLTLNSGTPSGGIYSGSGVTGNTFDASSLSAGNYVLTYSFINAEGCSASDTALVEVSICTSIENEVAEQILLYPNPFTNSIIIKIDGGFENYTAILMDATGRKISSHDFEQGISSIEVNTQSLESGAYLMGIFAEGKWLSIRKLFRME